MSLSKNCIEKTEQIYINPATLTQVLSKKLGTDVINANYQTKQLHGGTLGDVRLVTGTAETADHRSIPYEVVWKTQKKWERPGDPDSWRREYDFYRSDFSAAFTDSLRSPKCYATKLHGDDEIEIWMEHIDGVSGSNLTIEALEQAAEEWGRFQGRLRCRLDLDLDLGPHQHPGKLEFGDVSWLGNTGFMEREFRQWTSDTEEYRYLYSSTCSLPEHLRRMLITTQQESQTIFSNIKRLPVVLSHRDFWIENIFYSQDGKIHLIDWDCVGWGFAGEDIASLIADDTDVAYLDEYYRRLVPAYRRGLSGGLSGGGGLSECMDVAPNESFLIPEMIIIKFGYRFLQKFMFSQSPSAKNRQITALQKIHEIHARI